jgi:hypothetical protein
MVTIVVDGGVGQRVSMSFAGVVCFVWDPFVAGVSIPRADRATAGRRNHGCAPDE